MKIVGESGEATGGDGGDAHSQGGQGGVGGSCPLKPSGGNGGGGGDAKSKEGKGGKGTSSNGEDGTVQNEAGGHGGNGGDGCGPGKGGKGGSGNPPGKDGADGKKVCPPLEEKKPATVAPGVDVTPKSIEKPSGAKIKVIQYGGKYLPVNQLIIEDEVGCGAEHWHAAQGFTKATDGTPVPDPGPQCGYGKVNEHPVIEINAPSSESTRPIEPGVEGYTY